MTSRKKPEADLEGKRSLFFLIGLGMALLFVIVILQYKKAVYEKPVADPLEGSGVVKPIEIPPTWQKRPEPEKRAEKARTENPDKDVLAMIGEELTGEIDMTAFDLGKYDEEPEVVPIGSDEMDEPVEAIPWVSVQNIAHPADCGKGLSREEQLACLSSFISRHMQKNLRYPDKGRNLNGRVYVSFVIDVDGRVRDIKVERGEYELLNAEAVRVVSTIPALVPASQNGRKVPMQISIPVNFKRSY